MCIFSELLCQQWYGSVRMMKQVVQRSTVVLSHMEVLPYLLPRVVLNSGIMGYCCMRVSIIIIIIIDLAINNNNNNNNNDDDGPLEVTLQDDVDLALITEIIIV